MSNDPMTFDRVTAYGAAGGASRSGLVYLQVWASNCDTVDSVRTMTEAAPDMLAALEAAIVALECSEAIHSRYPEARQRHASAMSAVFSAIAKAKGG